MKYSLDMSSFLEEISNLSHSIVSSFFFFFFALFIEEGLLAIPWNFAFSWVYLSLSPFCFAFFFPQLFVKRLQRIILPSRISLC